MTNITRSPRAHFAVSPLGKNTRDTSELHRAVQGTRLLVKNFRSGHPLWGWIHEFPSELGAGQQAPRMPVVEHGIFVRIAV